ncbi:MAG: hypothetical protein ACRD1F_06490, partial [Terriglobales bacterium]
LLDRRSLARPYLNPGAAEEVVRRHLKGDRNYTEEIHRLLSLELLHRRFAGSRPAVAPALLASTADHR